jgi:hypothetical protein
LLGRSQLVLNHNRACQIDRVGRSFRAKEGILAFEQYEAEVVERAGEQLMAALQHTLKVVEDYYQRLADHILAQGISVASLLDILDEEPIPQDTGLPGHGGKI